MKDDSYKKDSNSAEEIDKNRLEGRNPVLEALRAGRDINKLWILQQENGKQDNVLRQIIYLAKQKNVPVVEMRRQAMDQMSKTHGHQGVIADAASHDYIELEDLLSNIEKNGQNPFLIMLDGLKDAYNLGSILRIADAAGADGIIIPKHRSVGLDALAAKASAGAIEYVPVVRVTNLSQTIVTLKERGFWVAGTDSSGDVDYKTADYCGSLLIVIGSEGEGMSRIVKSNCDFLLSIPMFGHVNSLNAAVAAGIVIFEAQSQRSRGK